MGKQTANKLTAKAVERETKPGYYNDGNGLYLAIRGASKSWIFRFRVDGKLRDMGLGGFPAISLAEARTKAADAKKLLKEGQDPIAASRRDRTDKKLQITSARSFSQCAEAYIEQNKAGWSNPKHTAQWESTLSTYVYPIIGNWAVQDVDTDAVLRCLEPIWTTKTETASRLRGRIEAVLAWASARELRPKGFNPATWRGHLDAILPKPSKVATVEHFAALPYADMGVFMEKLRGQEGIGARCLEFAILTAARSGEARGAKWSEIDLDKRVWVIPAERMKAGKEHHIPLSDAALKLLKSLPRIVDNDLVFPAPRGKQFSDMTLTAVLRRMNTGVTAHGFRSSLRDWAGETTAFPREVVEHALAHQLKDKAEAAYQRGTLFDKRRLLMQAWSEYCGQVVKAGAVTPMRGKSKTAA